MKHLNNEVIKTDVFVKIADLFPDLDDSDLTKPVDPKVPWGFKQYTQINQMVRDQSRKLAFTPFVNYEKSTKGRELVLTDLGAKHIALMRSTKCARKNCLNNLGQQYKGFGRQKFNREGVEELDDFRVLDDTVAYGYEQLFERGAGPGKTEWAIKNEVNLAEWEQKGYCGWDCMKVQERANENKSEPIPDVLKKAMRQAGFTYYSKSDRDTPTWKDGPNNCVVIFDRKLGTIKLNGFGLYYGRPQYTTLGNYTLGEISKLVDDVKRTQPKEYWETKAGLLRNKTPEETTGLEALAKFARQEIKKNKADLDRARKSLAKYGDDPGMAGALVGQIAACEGAIIELQRKLELAELRLADDSQLIVTPLRMLLSDEQREAIAQKG